MKHDHCSAQISLSTYDKILVDISLKSNQFIIVLFFFFLKEYICLVKNEAFYFFYRSLALAISKHLIFHQKKQTHKRKYILLLTPMSTRRIVESSDWHVNPMHKFYTELNSGDVFSTELWTICIDMEPSLFLHVQHIGI